MQVLIVDDDIATVDVIEKTVDWEKLEVSGVYTAYNITNAKKILSENTIDIIISDIEMPMGSGLDLLEWFREEKLPGKILLLTCHESFDYATYAIKYRASDYLLKPFDVNVMEAALKKIIQKIREEQQVLENSEYGKWARQNQRQLKITFWNQLLTGHIAGNAFKIQEEIADRRLDIDHQAEYRLVISKITNTEKEKEKMNPDLMLFIMENIHSEVLCGTPDNDSVVSMDYKEAYIFVTVCRVCKGEKVAEKCEELRKNFKQLFSADITVCISRKSGLPGLYEVFHEDLNLIDGNVGAYGTCFKEEDSADVEQAAQSIMDLDKVLGFLENRKKMEFLSYLKSQLSDREYQKKLNENVLRQAKEEIQQSIYIFLAKKEIPAVGLFSNEDLNLLCHRASQSVIHMIRWVSYLLDCTFEYMESVQKQYTLGEKVNRYLKEHYREPIRRETVAEQFHLAPEYLSKVYIKQTGKKIKDTLAEYRIEEAKHLLECGERVSDVAEAVGFDNFTYFSTTFKKYTGISPNQYRKK